METLKIVRTLKELESLSDYLKDKEYVSYDIETTGLEKRSEIIGLSVCADPEVGYYVIFSYWDVEAKKLQYLETHSAAKNFVESLKSKKLIMHNGVFDCAMTNNYLGVDLMPFLHTDTMILGHVLNENRKNGLKELGVAFFGEDSRQEQIEMRQSVHSNGGSLTKDLYELYKADADLIARYGAKDAILTLKIFYVMIPELIEQGLDKFFYEDESMPLLRGPTYQLNTTGLKVSASSIAALKRTLEAECMEAKAFINSEIANSTKEKYKGTTKGTTFNIGSSSQLAWLLFVKLENPFNNLTKEGKEICKSLGLKIPYTRASKREFIETCIAGKGRVYQEAIFDKKKQKEIKSKKIRDFWYYLACGKESLGKMASRYAWVARLLEYKKNLKILNTYVEGIEARVKYGVIQPSFLQHGTTSGRYSCKNPNFQNLPRDDKRVKACIVARPGMVFVGADYSQLEPRVFASFSEDERLLKCFKDGEDFYSVIGMEVFEKTGVSLKKDDPNSFAKKYPELRQISKVIALSVTYGTTAPKLALTIDSTREEAQQVIDSYLYRFPGVHKLMLESHSQAMKEGQVLNRFGRPRRISKAMEILDKFPGVDQDRIDYEYRNLLNLAVNHRIQSTAASIMNRAAILFCSVCADVALGDPRWAQVKVVLQVHDELNVEAPEALGEEVAAVLKYSMEQAVELPGVDLVAEPKIAYNLAELK